MVLGLLPTGISEMQTACTAPGTRASSSLAVASPFCRGQTRNLFAFSKSSHYWGLRQRPASSAASRVFPGTQIMMVPLASWSFGAPRTGCLVNCYFIAVATVRAPAFLAVLPAPAPAALSLRFWPRRRQPGLSHQPQRTVSMRHRLLIAQAYGSDCQRSRDATAIYQDPFWELHKLSVSACDFSAF
jgi:hypothetical protein